VPQGKETAVEFTPDKEGEYTFMCGMDMLKGTIIVKQS
jgi:plastocyanin domain-containing protein